MKNILLISLCLLTTIFLLAGCTNQFNEVEEIVVEEFEEDSVAEADEEILVPEINNILTEKFTTIAGKKDFYNTNFVSEGDNVRFMPELTGKSDVYNWRSSIDGHLSSNQIFVTNDLSPGIHLIYFKVGLGDKWSDEVNTKLEVKKKATTVTTKAPTKPEAKIDYITPTSAEMGDKVEFSGDKKEKNLLSKNSIPKHGCSWRSNIDGQLSSGCSFSSSSLSVGTHTIYLKVRSYNLVLVKDGKTGKVYSDWSEEVSQEKTIKQTKTAPSAHIDSIFPNLIKDVEEASLSGHGEGDNEIVAYEWRSDISGVLSDLSSATVSELSPGTHAIYFKVQDNNGVWSEEASSTLVVENTFSPVAYIDMISPNPATTVDDILFVANGEDSDGVIIACSWRMDDYGVISDQCSFGASEFEAGTYVFYLQVQDNDGLWSEEVTGILEVNE